MTATIKIAPLGLLLLSLAAGSFSTAAAVAPPRRTIVSVLSGCHVVGRGLIIRMGPSTRHYVAACGGDTTSRTLSFDTVITVSDVLHGTIDDSVFVVSTHARPSLPRGIGTEGTEVLFWGFRVCEDSWRVWGWYCGIDESGMLVPPLADPIEFYDIGDQAVPSARPITAAQVDSALAATISTTWGAAIQDVVALQLCRVVGACNDDDGVTTYDVDTLRTLIGAPSGELASLTIRRIPTCSFSIQPGDSILVPLPSSIAAGRVDIVGCPDWLLVQGGYVPWYGVPLTFIHAAVQLRGGVLARRKILYGSD